GKETGGCPPVSVRIILFDRQSTKNLKSGTLQALQNEIEQRLKPHYPEIWLHMWESPSFRVGSCQPALY
ncbi:TPA: hypothetical protein ACIBZR_004577, partial [Salmonella enterica subsp. enterica serovar Saintpaul]